MKKAIAIITALALMFALCACGSSGSSSASLDEAASTEAKPFFPGKWVMETLEYIIVVIISRLYGIRRRLCCLSVLNRLFLDKRAVVVYKRYAVRFSA